MLYSNAYITMRNITSKSNMVSSPPLYRQVENFLREQIQSGQLQPGDMLPTVRELCEQFGGINHLTVRQALRILTDENLIYSVQGKGSFVASKTKTQHCIALVLPNLEDYIFLKIARGVQNVFDAEGVRTLILDSRGNWDKEAQNIQHLREFPLDGAIIFPLAHHDIAEQIFRMKLDDFPFVLIDRYFEDIETPSIVANNYQGGYDITAALIKRKHINFAWLGELTSSSAKLRLQGFRDALNDNGLACPRERIRTLKLAPAASHQEYIATLEKEVGKHLQALLQSTPSTPQTLVFADDQSALIALRILQEQGHNVPGDIAIAGFDDRPEGAQSNPPLTTVRQPMEQMGEEAARAALQRVENPTLPIERVCLPVEIVLRKSA